MYLAAACYTAGMSYQTPSLIEMVSALVQTPSVSSTQQAFDQSNNDVIDLLANWLDPLGFSIDIIPIENKPGKSNLIARIGSGRDGLLLSGHSDTVPFDEHLWQSNPFALTEQDDKWFGLGSADMKSFFALAIEAVQPFLNEKLQHPLVIIATADEESSMSGARQLTRQQLDDVRYAVIGEPTNLQPITRHKGIMMMNLRVEGASGHSSDPSRGNNAIEGLHKATSELMKLRSEMISNYTDTSFEVPTPTLNFGCVHGGDNPNRICDHAELAFDLRNLPSMDMQDFVEELEYKLQSCLEPDGFQSSLTLLHPPVPAFENTDSSFATEVEELTQNTSNSVAFGTEAPFLKALDLDTVVIGPGSIDQAHQPNEYLPVDQINPAVDLLQSLIKRHCL